MSHSATSSTFFPAAIPPTHSYIPSFSPPFPSSAFGYVRSGDALPGHPGAQHVAAFVEKPSVEVATGYLADGGYRWNAGMFVVRPSVLLDLLGERDPDFAAALRAIAAEPARLGELWATLPRIASLRSTNGKSQIFH